MPSSTDPDVAEAQRLEALRALFILDTEPEPVFDSITALASQICGVPMALLSLIDEDRQWFKSGRIAGASGTPRGIAFCTHAILADDLLEVPDARDDARFAGNPLVTGGPGIRFYAGAPLTLPGGERVGTLCVADPTPRKLSAEQSAMLTSLASIATDALLMRQSLIAKSLSARSAYEQSLRANASFLQRTGRVAGVGGWEFDCTTGEVTWSEQTRRIHAVDDDYRPSAQAAMAFYPPAARETFEHAMTRAAELGLPWDLELPFVSATGQALWLRSVGEVEFDAGQPVRLIGTLQDITERRQLRDQLASGARFIRQVTDSLAVRIWYIDKDRLYRFVNQAHCTRFGKTREEMLGRTDVEVVGGPDDLAVEPRLAAVLAGDPQHFELDETIAGTLRRFEITLYPDIGEAGEVLGVFGTGVDITQRSAAERKMRSQAATLRSVTESMPALVAVLGPDCRYRLINSAFERWIGARRETVIGRTMAEVLGRDDHARSSPWIERALNGETVQFEKEFALNNLVHHLIVNYIPLWMENGEIDGFVAVAQDISVHRREELRLRQLTQLDALTGLLNRAGFETFLEHADLESSNAELALLYIDLDHFKAINDQHGHPMGDLVLREFATRLRAIVRPTDCVARLGGDEFAVVLRGVREIANAQKVADKIVAQAALPFQSEGLQLRIGASVGIAYDADAAGGWAGLVARADAMLYRAKQGGRSGYVGESTRVAPASGAAAPRP